MGIFGKLTGTRRPASGVEARSAEEVRDALLGVGRPDAPYVIRDGAPEGADLVAEWRVMEPAWRHAFYTSRVSRLLQIRMRLAAEEREVRAVDHTWEVEWVGGAPRLAASAQRGRGTSTTISRQWTLGRGAAGRLELTETFRFDSRELKDPLRDAVLAAGWTWRGVAFGKL